MCDANEKAIVARSLGGSSGAGMVLDAAAALPLAGAEAHGRAHRDRARLHARRLHVVVLRHRAVHRHDGRLHRRHLAVADRRLARVVEVEADVRVLGRSVRDDDDRARDVHVDRAVAAARVRRDDRHAVDVDRERAVLRVARRIRRPVHDVVVARQQRVAAQRARHVRDAALAVVGARRRRVRDRLVRARVQRVRLVRRHLDHRALVVARRHLLRARRRVAGRRVGHRVRHRDRHRAGGRERRQRRGRTLRQGLSGAVVVRQRRAGVGRRRAHARVHGHRHVGGAVEEHRVLVVHHRDHVRARPRVARGVPRRPHYCSVAERVRPRGRVRERRVGAVVAERGLRDRAAVVALAVVRVVGLVRRARQRRPLVVLHRVAVRALRAVAVHVRRRPGDRARAHGVGGAGRRRHAGNAAGVRRRRRSEAGARRAQAGVGVHGDRARAGGDGRVRGVDDLHAGRARVGREGVRNRHLHVDGAHVGTADAGGSDGGARAGAAGGAVVDLTESNGSRAAAGEGLDVVLATCVVAAREALRGVEAAAGAALQSAAHKGADTGAGSTSKVASVTLLGRHLDAVSADVGDAVRGRDGNGQVGGLIVYSA
mmetsp:Transcript_19831/g.76008  ORF Transcript_19831/g.76008 Transcript_19831/m.76008 type:complete len:598 (-) Transcript_19831:471-2264(-)